MVYVIILLLLLAGRWFASRPLTPRRRQTLLFVFVGSATLTLVSLMAVLLVAAIVPAPAPPPMRSLMLVLIGLLMVGFAVSLLFGPLVWRDLTEPPQRWITRPRRLQPTLNERLGDWLLVLAGICITTIGLVFSLTPALSKNESDPGYFALALGLAGTAGGLVQILLPAHRRAAELAAWITFAGLLAALWFGARFLIGQFW
ncbi:MAG TPA: hypothetical protein VFS21_02980 [Roseiflexaceae bacterium]|nr:hypothetical protein [Roseiflexaceae bacterium]